ncbi:hypothetical protein EDB81DRAFT_484908 [Dactylonectria macrodidyma]|uniref:Protein kinase domain-containing protein n=1 Tax=Dactylonectria macrodidyma TaxID=307937 RepID=A0A9P9J266_9HYPO|nr:hypothetical protein EDB81DRAFT_484908 [Dactylonectria macrodidyma]
MAESDFFGNQGFLESTARNLPPSTAVGLDVQGQPSSTGVAQGETLPRETLPKQPRFDYVHFVTFLGLRGIRIFPIEDVELKQSSHERQAGRGVSMSVVYGEVRDGENVRKPVAVKRAAYLGGQHSAAQGAAHDTWLLDLFFELQIMVHPSIQASNNIVRLLGIAFDDRDSDAAQPLAPWVIVEPAHEAFINLRGYFESQQRPATKQLSTACSLIADAADGLAILHVHSVIHGDVKPDNILIFPAPSGDGVMAKICDFGFSSISNPEDHDERRPLGLTRDWAAPEHDSGKGPPAFAQDVYSFGLVVAYIVLSGRRHLQELIDQADYSPVRLIDEIKTCLSRHPEDIADCPIDIRERIVALAQQCLARRPEDRPKSLESVRGFLCRADGQLDEGGTLRETVVPLPKSISSMAPESAHTDVTLARVYQGMKTASGKLPKWLRDRLVEQVEETLAHHQSDSEGPLGVKGGIDQRQRIQAAETALWTLHTLGTGSPPLAIPGYIDLADSGKRHELFAKLYRRQPSRFVLDNPLEEIRQFAEKAPTHGHAVADDGTSLYLHVAVYRNSPDLISWLIGAGASPDEMSPAGWSPLHVAVAMLHETCAAVLLDSGCNPNLPSRTQHGPQATPLATLVREGQIMAQAREADPKLRKFRSIYNLLIDRNADPWMTNVPGHHEPVSFMRMDGPLSAGVMSVVLDRHPMLANARDRSMETPIMRAAINGNLGVMRELLAHGADIEAADIVGYRTLHKLWNNMIDVKTIESRYWPFQSDLRPDSMRRRQAMTPIAQMRAAHDLLVSRGAGQGPSTGISSDTPAQSGFSNLRNILGPDRTCSLVASRIFSFRDVILYRHRGWLKEVVTINSVHPNGWLFRKLEPGELETLECLAREPKELQILRPTRHPSVVQLHICGAFPLDVAWPYYLVIRLGKIASMGEFQIRIRLTDVVGTSPCYPSHFC